MPSQKEKIYEKLRQVPKGRVVTYGELARSIGINAFACVANTFRSRKDGKQTQPCIRKDSERF